ncbi:WecB/TagA/CpsF family glycosyltransferase [Microbulbifer salipaludis]|uniref:WecB/TagA/CpsF family glycosyltransferase n=2 Tax=Microbulbifer salipaludis TaxID=187980 RepID=A0ABS3E2G8_9GAMM|nr:WecB/TagA/CpsF family glycosyltransferase [Microbulbifer salipaludis]
MQPKVESLNLGLCRIDMACMDRVLSEIRFMRCNNKKGYIITPNIDHLARLAEVPSGRKLRDLYFSATLSLCDSRILEFILKAHGYRLPGVVTGSDLTARLFQDEIKKEDKVYILGGDVETIEKIRSRFPYIDIAHHNPSMGFIRETEEVNDVVANIVDSHSNYVFLAVGSPQQEIIASKLMSEQRFGGLAFCIGASMLFLAGSEKRAPHWMQRLRLEWLYRMMQNPKRLAMRYFNNALKLPFINRQIAIHLRQKAES